MWRRNVVLSALLVVSMAFAGCGGGGDDSGSVDGPWFFTNAQGVQENLDLSSSGNALSGSSDRGGGTIAGTISDRTVTFAISYGGSTLNMNLVWDGDASMTGTMTDATGATQAVTLTKANTDVDDSEESLSGPMSGTWSGMASVGVSVGGVFELNIAADGTVTGTYSGSGYSGTINGTVDRSGSLVAAGRGSGSGVDQLSWEGVVLRAGNGALAGSGTWSSVDDNFPSSGLWQSNNQ